jgi:hypothetical protein
MYYGSMTKEGNLNIPVYNMNKMKIPNNECNLCYPFETSKYYLISISTRHAPHLHYKGQSVNDVWVNNCWFLPSRCLATIG